MNIKEKNDDFRGAQAMRSKLKFLSTVLLAWAISPLLAQQVYAGSVSVEEVKQLLVADADPDSVALNDNEKEALVNSITTYATRQLDPNNRLWNEKNSNWGTVSGIVHSDIARDIAEFLPIAERGRSPKNIYAKTAEKARKDDIDTILTYYNTLDGKRYREFIIEAKSLHTGEELLKRDGARVSSPQEQFNNYVKIIRLMPFVAGIAAEAETDRTKSRDTTGYGDVIGLIIIPPIIANHQNILDDLYRQYSRDLEEFERFESSESEQRFLVAYGSSWIEQSRDSKDETESWVKKELLRYRDTWSQAYRNAQAR